MGLFSLFRDKKDKQPAPTPSGKDDARKKRDAAASESERNQTAQVQREAAHATARKIDAIESEMSSEFVKPLASVKVPSSNSPTAAVRPVSKPQAPLSQQEQQVVENTFQPTLPMMGLSTEFLLGGETAFGQVKISESHATPIIEEAAILFANDQMMMVEQVLLSSINDEQLGTAAPIVWGMLFDLYQVTNQQAQFENLSIEYANKFETSPPAWFGLNSTETAAAPLRANATPVVPFTGRLDSSIVKLLERAQNLAEKSPALRLEFSKVSEVDPIGCGMLHSVLKRLQKSGHDLILVGAPDLAKKIRGILEVGRRDETEAPWLLLLEILRLLNLESEFEEASIDYCVTFEVSPPAFVAPKNKVTTEFEETAATDAEIDRLMMPSIIEGRTDALIESIVVHSQHHNPAILDCARLSRVDFGSAGQLLSGLAPLARNGKVLEFHNVNYLVAALFNVMGLSDIVRILPRKS